MTEAERHHEGRDPESAAQLAALTTPGEGGTPGAGPAVSHPPFAAASSATAPEPAVVAAVAPPPLPESHTVDPPAASHTGYTPPPTRKRRSPPPDTDILGHDEDGSELAMVRQDQTYGRTTTTSTTATSGGPSPTKKRRVDGPAVFPPPPGDPNLDPVSIRHTARAKPPRRSGSSSGTAPPAESEQLKQLKGLVPSALKLQDKADATFQSLREKEREQINSDAFGMRNASSDGEPEDEGAGQGNSPRQRRSRRGATSLSSTQRPRRRSGSAGRTPFRRQSDAESGIPPARKTGNKPTARGVMSSSEESEPEPAAGAPHPRLRSSQPDFEHPDSENDASDEADDGKSGDREEKEPVPPSRARRPPLGSHLPQPHGPFAAARPDIAPGHFPPLLPRHEARALYGSAQLELHNTPHHMPTHSEPDDLSVDPKPSRSHPRGKKRSGTSARDEDREPPSPREEPPSRKRPKVIPKPRKRELDEDDEDVASQSSRHPAPRPAAKDKPIPVDLTGERDPQPRKQPIFTLAVPRVPSEWRFLPRMVHQPHKLRYDHYRQIIQFVNKGERPENIFLPRVGLLYRHADRSRLGSAQRDAWIQGEWTTNTGTERTKLVPKYSLYEMYVLRIRHEQGASPFICVDRRPKLLPSRRSYPVLSDWTPDQLYSRWPDQIRDARRDKKFKGRVVQYLMKLAHRIIDQHQRQVLQTRFAVDKAWLKVVQRTLFLAFKYGALANIPSVSAADLSPADKCWRSYYRRFVDSGRTLADQQAELAFQQAVLGWLGDNQETLEEFESAQRFQNHQSNFFSLTSNERKKHGWSDPDESGQGSSGKRRKSSRRPQPTGSDDEEQSEPEPERDARRKPSRRRKDANPGDERDPEPDSASVPPPPPDSEDDGSSSSSSPSPAPSRDSGKSKRRKKDKKQRDTPDYLFGRKPSVEELVDSARSEAKRWGGGPPLVREQLTRESIRATFQENVDASMRNDEPYCRRVLADIDRRLQKPIDLSEGALLFDRRKDAMGDYISETDESSVSHSSDPEYHTSARQCDPTHGDGSDSVRSSRATEVGVPYVETGEFVAGPAYEQRQRELKEVFVVTSLDPKEKGKRERADLMLRLRTGKSMVGFDSFVKSIHCYAQAHRAQLALEDPPTGPPTVPKAPYRQMIVITLNRMAGDEQVLSDLADSAQGGISDQIVKLWRDTALVLAELQDVADGVLPDAPTPSARDVISAEIWRMFHKALVDRERFLANTTPEDHPDVNIDLPNYQPVLTKWMEAVQNQEFTNTIKGSSVQGTGGRSRKRGKGGGKNKGKGKGKGKAGGGGRGGGGKGGGGGRNQQNQGRRRKGGGGGGGRGNGGKGKSGSGGQGKSQKKQGDS